MCLKCTHSSVTVALPTQIFTTLTNTKKRYVKFILANYSQVGE